MKIFIASDHAGFERKQEVIQYLLNKGIQAFDEGPKSKDSVDYPDFADLVCRHFKEEHSHLPSPLQIGILICGSGQGMAIRANRWPFVRAALCWNKDSATLAREHNDANILCFGARAIDLETSKDLIDTFIATSFAGGRHETRVVKLGKIPPY
jgi:ribose 5-phosphate isomerase B